MRRVKSAAELFWPKVAIRWTDECWEWTGARSSSGYGSFTTGRNRGLTGLPHRLSYLMLKGDPGNLVIDHLCRNKLCVNPQHLEAVSQEVNVHREREANRGRRGQGYNSNKDKAHCIRGHSEWKHNGRQRVCIPCQRDSWRKENAKRKKV